MVEIGPGRGALTRPLAKRAGRVIAVEIDPRLARSLRSSLEVGGHARQAGSPRVEIVQDDFLRWPLPDRPYKVFANPPFAHTAEIVRRLSEAELPPTDAWLLLEHRAARRFAGAPFAAETLRSLLLKPDWHLELRDEVEPREFSPPVRERCVLLWMARRSRSLIDASERALYGDFIAAAFGRSGDCIERCLRGLLSPEQLRRAGHTLHFDRMAPPSQLSFEQWLGLFRCFEERAGPSARRRVQGAIDRLPRAPKSARRRGEDQDR